MGAPGLVRGFQPRGASCEANNPNSEKRIAKKAVKREFVSTEKRNATPQEHATMPQNTNSETRKPRLVMRNYVGYTDGGAQITLACVDDDTGSAWHNVNSEEWNTAVETVIGAVQEAKR